MMLILPSLTKGQETRTIDGRKYFVHIVQAGQTLYGIGRIYGVPSADAIAQANPGSADGLSIGEEILVPKDLVVKKEARVAPTLSDDGALRHTVAKKETLYGIARKYGVEVEDLLARNPEVNGAVQAGQVIIVPVDKVKGQSELVMRPALPPNTIVHVVKPGETLFSLGQLYGIEPEAIQAANGGLIGGLKSGASINIPGSSAGPAHPIITDTLVRRDLFHVGLLLPFSIARNDSTLQATALAAEGPRYYEATRIAAQFYGGAMMAMDSMRSLGLNAEVTVLDLGDDPNAWGPAMRRKEIPSMDLFIGPFHRAAIEELSRVNTRAHIVCPVPQSNKVILGQPTVSKVTPTRSDLVKHAARYVAMRHARDNVILLRPDLATEKELQEQAGSALQQGLSAQPSRLRDSVLVAKPGRRDLGDLPSKLSTSQLNVIVAPSEDVELVTTLVGKLKPLAAKHRIMLVGLESWLDMGSVAANDLDVLGFTFAASTFIDHADPRVEAFVEHFRERYKTDADEYAFLGFDVTFYYLTALLKQGTGFAGHFDQVRTEPLHMGFRMQRTGPENGFKNEYGIMLQQRELQLHRAP